jgi:hypothetical protein
VAVLRQLSHLTPSQSEKFPIPMVEELLNELCGVTFSKLDLRFDYHQVLMHPTAFMTHEGLFEFLLVSFRHDQINIQRRHQFIMG